MRVAVIGLGSIGRRHAANFKALGCAIVEWDLASAQTDLQDALRGSEGCVIATPPDSHLRLAWAAVNAGCHVMLEKPLGLDEEGWPALFKRAELTKRTVMVAYPWRYDPEIQALKARMAEIGEPLYIRAWYGYQGVNETAATMGVHLDCSHIYDLLRFVTGAPGTILSQVDVFHDAPLRREFHILGTTGSLHWVRNDRDINYLYPLEAAHFLKCIAGDARPLTDGWDALQTLRVVRGVR